MTNATQGGRSFRGRRPDLWYFDRLPPTAHAALANAAFDWSVGSVFNKWNRGIPGYKTGAAMAMRIANADERQIFKGPEARMGDHGGRQ
jgi:hypothetical protein